MAYCSVSNYGPWTNSVNASIDWCYELNVLSSPSLSHPSTSECDCI
jgi:hypothetical protein